MVVYLCAPVYEELRDLVLAARYSVHQQRRAEIVIRRIGDRNRFRAPVQE